MATCLTCQAEAARYRKLTKALAALTVDLVAAPEGFAASVDIAIDRADTATVQRVEGRLGKVAAATGAVAAAGVVAVALWRRSHYAA